MKQCNHCQELKPFTDFHKRGSDGYQPKCKSCKSLLHKDRYINKREHILQKNLEWRKSNPEHMRMLRTRFTRKHPRYNTYYRALKRCSERSGVVPFWVDLATLKQVYAACPQGMEVDHIVPLNNPKVCGLHVPWNLQYLSVHENRIKHNKF